MSSIEKLIQISSNHFLESDINLSTKNEDLNKLLKLKNGFFTFESSLRVFPTDDCEKSCGLETFNSQEFWKKFYGNLADGCYFFAEDIFGNQFCYFENEIYQFDAETGDKKYLAKNIEDWSNKILSEFNFLTGYSLAHDWQLKNGTIPYKMRLIPTKLFILGGEYSIDNLRLVDSLEGLKIRGPIAQSILNLENKTKVKINLVD